MRRKKRIKLKVGDEVEFSLRTPFADPGRYVLVDVDSIRGIASLEWRPCFMFDVPLAVLEEHMQKVKKRRLMG